MMRFLAITFVFVGIIMVIHGSYEEKYQKLQNTLDAYEQKLEEAKTKESKDDTVSGYNETILNNVGSNLDNAFDAFPEEDTE